VFFEIVIIAANCCKYL